MLDMVLKGTVQLNNKLLVSVLLAILLVIPMTLAIPENITVQGRLTDDSASPLSGSVSMNFSIYTVPTGGTAAYSLLDQTVNLDDSGVWYHTLYNVDLAFDSEYYLGVSVNGEAEMSPRIVLTSSPYAYVAKKAEGLSGSSDLQVNTINASVAVNTSKICIGDDCRLAWPGYSAKAFSCPANFTLIENNGYVLGCMQDETSSPAVCRTASENCWENYGGRLPSYSEITVSMKDANFGLNNENVLLTGNANYYLDNSFATHSSCGVIYNHSGTIKPWAADFDSAYNYKCFIPASGQTSGWNYNVSDLNTSLNVAILGELTLGSGKIRFNSTSNTYEFYNGSDWQEIGTGAAGSSGASQWNITGSSYLINNSGVLDINETALNNSIDARASSSAAGWVNNSQATSTALNVSLGDKITFALGAIIKNVVNGWLTITGNTIVEGDLNATGDLGLNGGNISYDSGRLLVDGTQLGTEDSRVNIVCPTGFTRIENNGYVLGCMQNNEDGSANCGIANLNCFNNHGGRLPVYSELHLAFNKYNLNDETDDFEWLGEGSGGTVGSCAGIQTTGWPGYGTSTSSQAYRCFIPAQSGTPWENVTDGISYSQNVSITGDLTARKLCLNGTCFTQLPNQDGIAPAFSVTKDGTSQSTAQNQYVEVIWQTENFDTNNDFYLNGESDSVTSCSNCFRPSVPGYYLLTGTIRYSDAQTSYFHSVSFSKNDVLYHTGEADKAQSGGAMAVSGSTLVYANGTDYFKLESFHNYIGARTIDGSSTNTQFSGARVDSGSPWLLENGNATLDADANITGTLTLGDGKIRYNSSSASFEFYNGTVWQEIGTGAAGSGSGSQWSIENNYIVNVSDVLSFNETLLNATIDARTSASAGIWDNVSGTATFNGDANITGDLALAGGNLSYSGGDLRVDGKVVGYQNSNVNIVCPTGFTRIENNGYVLGCMQTDDNAAATWQTASENCFNTYGGRLPSLTEIQSIFAAYTLTAESTEWIDNLYQSTGGTMMCSTAGENSISGTNCNSATVDYRCFIPAQSGTPWENVTDGISYSQNVSITGDLTARKLCINGTCFTSLPYANEQEIAFKATSSALTSITGGGSDTLIPINTETLDTNNDFDTTNNRFTVSVPGTYLFTGLAEFQSLATNTGRVYIRKNGVSKRWGTLSENMDGTQGVSSIAVWIDNAEVGDYYDFGAVNYHASAVNVWNSASFEGFRVNGGYWDYSDGNITFADGNVNITNELWLGGGRIRFNDTAKTFEFYNGTTWQEIGTGAAGSESGSQWNIENNYIVNVSDVLSFNEALLNATIDARSSSSGAGWSNSSTTTSTSLNVSIGDKLTFAFGEVIDNIVDGWLTITGNLILPENGYINFNDTTGSAGYGIRDNDGNIQYKDTDGVWKSLSTQTPTGNVVWTKIWEYDVESATDKIVITGLDGNSDRIYQMHGNIISEHSSGNCAYIMNFNEDTGSNYGFNLMYSDGTVTPVGSGGSTATGITVAWVSATNKVTAFDGTINAKNGSERIFNGKRAEGVNLKSITYHTSTSGVWSDSVNNIENLTISASQANGFGIGSHIELWAPRPVEVSNVNVVCPSGFTKIQNNGYVLGCMQTNEEGTDSCQNAILDCYDTYGGKLPSYNEIYTAFSRYALSGESGMEWTDVGYYDADGGTNLRCGVIDGSMNPSGNTHTDNTNFQYRCFIPAQGASNWVNGTGGLGYEGDVNITGTLKLGEGSIRFNSTSAAYEFYNGSDWQEIGTGAAGLGGSGDGAGWSNTSTVTSTSLNVQVNGNITPGTNDTYTLGTPDNVWKEVYVGNNSLWIGNKKISNDGGKLVWDGMDVNLNGTNLSVDSYVNFNGTEGTNGFGFREENGKMQYKDADGVWKSLSTQTPTGNVVWTKIWEHEVTGSAEDKVVLSGLDGDVDKTYKVIAKWVSNQASPNGYQIHLNSDTSTNYRRLYDFHTSSTDSFHEGTLDYLYAGLTDTSGSLSHSEILISSKAGTVRPYHSVFSRDHKSGSTPGAYDVMGVWQNSASNIVNMTFSGAAANSLGIGTHIEVWAPRPVEVSNVNIVCPTGFTKIQNNGYVLGCMQNAEEGNALCINAITDCFDTYGGRLPSFSEIKIAFNSYTLQDETDSFEWTDSSMWADASFRCGLIDAGGGPNGGNEGDPYDYRCFIPAQGASNWVNGTGGLTYNGSINITDELTLGSGKIRFNDTSASYEFFNGTTWQEIGTGAAGSGGSDGTGGWTNTSTTTSTGLNLSIGNKITYALGAVIENIATGFVSITGNLIVGGNAEVQGNLNVTGNITTDEYLNFNGTDGSNGFGIRELDGRMQYKDSDGVWKSLSTQTPTGNVVWTKIWEYEAESAMTSIEILGLDGNSDNEYRLISNIIGGVSSASNIGLQLNGDTSTNYGTNFVSGDLSSYTEDTGSTSSAWMYIGYISDPTHTSTSETILQVKNGSERIALTSLAGRVGNTNPTNFQSGTSTWSNHVNNVVNMTILSTVASGIGAGSRFELWAPRPVEVSNVNVVCPSGFTKIQNNGYVLGCIKDTIIGTTALHHAASANCFDTYGGRLPSYDEVYLANSKGYLTDGGVNQEWTNQANYYDDGAGIAAFGVIMDSGNSLSPSAGISARNYRCFIPAQGASNWINTTAGLSYDGAINVTQEVYTPKINFSTSDGVSIRSESGSLIMRLG